MCVVLWVLCYHHCLLQPLTCTERIAFQASQDGLIQNDEATDQELAALAGRPEFKAVAKKWQTSAESA